MERGVTLAAVRGHGRRHHRVFMLRSWLPLVALLTTVVIWASNNIVTKVIVHAASAGLVALVRFTLAGLLFYLPVVLRLHRGDQRFARSDWPRLVHLGSVGVVGSPILSLLGLRSTPATDASVYTTDDAALRVGVGLALVRCSPESGAHPRDRRCWC